MATRRGSAALVQGATGGVGLALVRRLLGAPSQSLSLVFAACRTPSAALLSLQAAHPGELVLLPDVDLRDDESIAGAAAEVAAKMAETSSALDLVLHTSGLLHRAATDTGAGGIQPEKRLADLSIAAAMENFQVNTVGPMMTTKHFMPLLVEAAKARRKEGKAEGNLALAPAPPPTLAVLSARVGSISDNRLGGWYSYRCSKAALNQFAQTASLEVGRRGVAVVALHPGTVDTGLSEPFSRNAKTLFTPDYSAEKLLEVLDGVTLDDSGKQTGGCFAWDGARIPA